MSKKITALIPGAALALGIACIAKWLETLESSAGLHLIGASVIALFIGMAINAFFQPNKTTAPGIKFTSKKVLKFAIVLLGASLNIRTVLTVGRFSLTVMLFTLATCFGLGALIGRALGLNWKTSSLINAGTGICGGSAIAAIAPVIEADDMDIAYGMSATFLFDTVMIVVFPLLGRWLGLSDAAFGLWAGTAVNDTSSVVATGYAFSEAAGDFATMVKLTRTLAIIPAVLVFAAINLHLKKKESAQANGVKVSIRSIFPWFILAFLAMSLLTFLPMDEVRRLSALKDAAINEAKKVLAYEVTKLVHGEEAARQAQEATEALFGGNAKDMSNVPAIEITPEDMTAKIIDVLTAAKVFSSKREARQLIAQGGLTVADTVLQDAEACLSADMFDADKSLLIRKGKKKYFRLLVK